jgi:hypothetical protein
MTEVVEHLLGPKFKTSTEERRERKKERKQEGRKEGRNEQDGLKGPSLLRHSLSSQL